ncbi:MAG TPA: PHB depolymerase family esterase [Albitalea sp.]|uniref:extracellular catalytic domain type 1 short-chain-length polyhydroxyalkanoate depolymerase n=1 Tax=Piscinibacter sp. TaxID=1903157 RepID=UPI002ED3C1E2
MAMAWIGWVLATAAANAAAAPPAAEGARTLVHQGLERHYVVRAPASASAALPLVLVLHGGGGNAAISEQMTGFTDKAMREGFVVVYPEGTARRGSGRLLTWNAGHCCGHAMERRVDDVGFIRALVDRLVAERLVDPRRVYVTGMSNGAMMAHRLGIELPDRIAAIAPVVGALFGDEPKPAKPVAALMINGRLDASVPPAGGAPGGRFPWAWDGKPALPALAQGSFWAAANGCGDTPEATERGPLAQWRYRCTPGREVELLIVADNGHAWPGGRAGSRRGDTPSTAVDATDLIWRFFQRQVKQR